MAPDMAWPMGGSSGADIVLDVVGGEMTLGSCALKKLVV